MEGRTTLLLSRKADAFAKTRIERLPLSNPGREARRALASAVGTGHDGTFHDVEHGQEAVETPLEAITSGELDAEAMTFNGHPVDGPTLAMLATARARIKKLVGMGIEVTGFIEVAW